MYHNLVSTEFLSDDRAGLLSAGFVPSLPIKITIHGFSDQGCTSWIRVTTYYNDSVKRRKCNMLMCMLFQRMKGSYHSVGDFNLFTVDWERLAMSPWYNTAAKNTKLVGRRTALLVEWLVCANIVLLIRGG